MKMVQNKAFQTIGWMILLKDKAEMKTVATIYKLKFRQELTSAGILVKILS